MKKNTVYVIHPDNWFLTNKEPFISKFISNKEAAKIVLGKEVSNNVCLVEVQLDVDVNKSTGFIAPIEEVCSVREWRASKKEIVTEKNSRYMYYEVAISRNIFCEVLFPEEYESVKKEKTIEILNNLQVRRVVPA